jgi:hypothetical protein
MQCLLKKFLSNKTLGGMSTVEFITVEDCFSISGRGVVVIPDFSIPPGWKDREETVTVATPDGRRYESRARFNMSHFNVADPEVPSDKRWRVVVMLLDRSKEELPEGSKIFVSPEVSAALRPDHTA